MLSSQYVVFKIDNENFALDITKVQEIIKPVEIARVPNVPDFIEGMINMRGKIHAVINLRSKFHFAKKQFDDNTKIILVNMGLVLIGIIVDAVTEILKVEEQDVDKTPEIISKVNDEFIKGVIKNGKDMVILIDVDRVVDSNAA